MNSNLYASRYFPHQQISPKTPEQHLVSFASVSSDDHHSLPRAIEQLVPAPSLLTPTKPTGNVKTAYRPHTSPGCAKKSALELWYMLIAPRSCSAAVLSAKVDCSPAQLHWLLPKISRNPWNSLQISFSALLVVSFTPNQHTRSATLDASQVRPTRRRVAWITSSSNTFSRRGELFLIITAKKSFTYHLIQFKKKIKIKRIILWVSCVFERERERKNNRMLQKWQIKINSCE